MKGMKWLPVAVLLAAAGSAWSAPVLILCADKATITAGQSFHLDVKLAVNDGDTVTSSSVFLCQAEGLTTNAFTVTAWDHPDTPFTNFGTPMASSIVNQLIPSTSGVFLKDLGGTVDTADADGYGIPIAPRTYTIATLTLMASNLLQSGQYTIASTPSSDWGDPTGLHGDSLAVATYTVTAAVPEPTCLGLLGATGLLMLGRRERQAGVVGR